MTKYMTEVREALESLFPGASDDTLDEAVYAIRIALYASGYVIVPREPTDAMKEAAHLALDWRNGMGMHKALLAAIDAALPDKEG